MVYESLFHVNYVLGFVFSVPTNDNFKFTKNFFIGLHAKRQKNLGVHKDVLCVGVLD